MAKKQSKKNLLKAFIGYGYHIWVILILANVLLIYTVQFYIKAAPKDEPPKLAENITPTEADTPTPTEEPSPTVEPTPAGPVLNVAFSIPGIGSNSANQKPVHKRRDLYILIYSPAVNSADKNVKPLYRLTSSVFYDTDPNSPTFTSFINPSIDLGETVKNGQYQFVFKLDQTLSTLVKDKENAVRGKMVELDKINPIVIPPQKFIVGDIYQPPHGDNIMDIKDHDMLLNCFGKKADTKTCLSKQNADLTDDGVVDGTDYNIMLGSFRTLKALGFPVPSLIPFTPTPAFTSQISKKPVVSKKPAKKPSPAPVKKSSGGAGGVLVFFFIVILLGVGGFVAYKKGLLKKFANPSPKSPATPPSATEGQEQAPPDASGETPTEEVAASTEIPVQETPVAPTEDQTAAASPANTDTAPQPTAPVAGAVDKEYYIKKNKADEANNAVWLTLTDDNGPIDGYYKGTEVVEGFAKVKGTMKTEGGKTYLEIADIIAE